MAGSVNHAKPFYHPGAVGTEIVGIIPVQTFLVVQKAPDGSEKNLFCIVNGDSVVAFEEASDSAKPFHESLRARIVELVAKYNRQSKAGPDDANIGAEDVPDAHANIPVSAL